MLALGVALHLWGLGRTGMRGDEAVYAGQAAILAGAEGYDRHFLLASRGNSNFLLYQELLSLVYRLVGVGDLAARLMSAILSTATVVVVFLTGRALYGRSAALLGALLLTISSYALSLGRLALLDPLVALLYTLALLCMIQWDRSRRTGWLVALAVTVSLAIQAKIVGVLLGAIFVGYLLLTGRWRALTWRGVLLSSAAFLICFVPALVQIAHSADQLTTFLGSSLKRRSSVPWYYYGRVLFTYEGLALPLVWLAGVVLAAVRRSRSDILPLLLIVVGCLFFQFYSLKSFNYLLVLVPTLCVLGGRALAELWVSRVVRLPGRVPVTAAIVALSLLAIPHLTAVLRDNTAAGLREVSQWLTANAHQQDGVMTLSHGSAQYVFSFYGHHDAYPFGRFRLATVLPGGEVVEPKPDPLGATPRDWVTTQPERLLRSGAVSYLVYYHNKMTGPTPQSEDGDEDPLVRTSTQQRFQQLISAYGGRLVHTVRQEREPIAWIYEVSRHRPRPVGAFTVNSEVVHLTAAGFQHNSDVRILYRGEEVGAARTGDSGELDTSFRLPAGTHELFPIVVADEAGRHLSLTGLPTPNGNFTVNGDQVMVRAGFTPGAHITATYHGRQVGTAVADDKGEVSLSFPLPDWTRPGYRLVLADAVGNTVTMTGLSATKASGPG